MKLVEGLLFRVLRPPANEAARPPGDAGLAKACDPCCGSDGAGELGALELKSKGCCSLIPSLTNFESSYNLRGRQDRSGAKWD